MAEIPHRVARAGPVGTLLAGIVEFGLAGTGVWFFLVDDDNLPRQQLFLALWGTVATIYLVVAGFRMRRRAFAEDLLPKHPTWSDATLPRWSTILSGRRFGFLLTVAASLVGLTSAVDVIHEPDPSTGIIQLGTWVMICAWLLLHLGYARFYSKWSQFRFPKTEYPQITDFLYFSVTLGVSFAVSDVEVQSHRLRWHVMVHSIISFFYNAIVLAVAIRVITTK